MPKAPNYITVPATIRKAEIAECAALYGCTNAFHLQLNSKTHEPKTVRFATFAGALKDDGLYHGELRFEPGDWKDSKPGNLNGLPGLGGKVADHHLAKESEE